MIPSIETIVEGLIDGNFTRSEAVTWLHMHANDANRDLRDEFAMAAMQGILASTDEREFAGFHEFCYQHADAMMKVREQ